MSKKKKMILILTTVLVLLAVILSLFVSKNQKINIENNNQLKRYINTIKEPGSIKEYKHQINPNTLTLTYKKSNDYYNYYDELEKNAALLFNKIKNLTVVTFNVNDKTYIFEYNKINLIFDKKLREISQKEVNERYRTKNFQNYIYLGNIKGKFDIFDKSEECAIKYLELYSDETYKYSIICSEVEKVYVNDGKKDVKLTDALKENKFPVDELFYTDIKIIKEEK